MRHATRWLNPEPGEDWLRAIPVVGTPNQAAALAARRALRGDGRRG
jgi:hypothetical protein